MIKTISLKCPDCGASLSINGELKHCFCQYCGTKIIIDDGSTTHTYRKIDEARIKEAEVNELIRLKELEIEENKRKATEKVKAIKVKISIILGIIGALLLAFAFIAGKATGDSYISLYIFAGLTFLIIGCIWTD